MLRFFFGKLRDNIRPPKHWLNKEVNLDSILDYFDDWIVIIIMRSYNHIWQGKRICKEARQWCDSYHIESCDLSQLCLCSLVFFIRNDPLCLMTMTLRWMKLVYIYIYQLWRTHFSILDICDWKSSTTVCQLNHFA